MIICFNCTAETKDELDRLVATGSYRDYGEAIAAAVRNQILMEQEVAAKGPIVISGPSLLPQQPMPEPVNDEPRPAPTAAAPKATRPPSPPRKRSVVAKDSGNGVVDLFAAKLPPTAPATVPAIFQREGLPAKPPQGLAELPSDMWAPGRPVPLDRWVLGQHNRLLPAKVNSRALIRLFADGQKGLSIGATAELLAAEAAVFGDYLAALDEAKKIPRDEALSTAFPTTREDAGKGRARYANQFVVYQNGRGELSGLMVDLKLINVMTQRKERFIVPTRVAWDFASLPNPVIDSPVDGVPEKFSPDERAFLIKHIIASVPVEAFAFKAILEAVQDGNNTPEKIDAVLKAHVAEDRAEKLSQSFLASQRSGAVSRMSDLGLVERQRGGVRVYYIPTDQGRTFLAEYRAAAN
ncbi:MAG: hypothetical protein ACLP7Q_02365 [Isosphaeraceae bacterium]